MRTFNSDSPGDDSPAFERWMIQHPEGYYINLLSARRGRLHRAHCGHIFPPTPGLDLVAHPKWVSDDRRQLEAAARAHGITLVVCRDCAP